ncbi:hypothetical protein [Actinoplanes subglobosus]|uniref:Uncharacterized protein n=1 Tax=Actinoplanes subglobosus TaxID=1547892 RepID=A0ABV8ISC7_9ACTN
MTELFARPSAHLRQRLATEPVLESWNAGSHPDQARLRAYLDEVAAQIGVESWIEDEPRTIELIVGLPDPLPLDSGGRDLDNYLFPVARRLGANRVAAAFGRKVHQQGSTIAIGAAVPAEEAATPALLTVRTSVSTGSPAWKQAIHQACRDAVAEPLPPGLVALQVVFGVSRHRNWTTLWKPAIDALGPMLGMPNPAKPYQPNDDRIVDLALHRHIDDTLHHDVTITAWWQPVTV